MRSGGIFVALSTFGRHGRRPVELLDGSGIPWTANPLGRRLTSGEIVSLASGAAGIVAGVESYDAAVLERLDGLRVISRCGVGIDNIDGDAARARGILVRNTPDEVVQPVAEMAVAMIFDLLRGLTRQTRALAAGRWEKVTGRMMGGAVIGILGLGRIGRRTAGILHGLGARVLGSDPAADEGALRAQGVEVVSEDDLLRRSEVLTLHLAHRPGHPFVLDAARIRRMRPGACVVNVARGGFVDEAALFEALSSGRLGGAALDVYGREPYRGPLADLENVILTPHAATLTRESREAMEARAVENLLESLQTRGEGT